MDVFTDRFISEQGNVDFLKANMMGPNAMRISEELALNLGVRPGMRILDLGCGGGLSTLLLVKKYGATVFAADLWISPGDNYERFKFLGIDDKAIPIHLDVTREMPFAKRYFDVLFCVDAWQYFGAAAEMLPSLVPFVKKGGCVAVAVPGLKTEFGENVPDEMRPFWNDEMQRTLHSVDWWRNLWSGADDVKLADCREMACCKQAWDEWLESPNLYAAQDREMMKAENGQYFNFVQLVAGVLAPNADPGENLPGVPK